MYISIQVNIKVVINLTIPETVVTLGTQDTGRRQTTQKQKHNIENKDEQHEHHHKPRFSLRVNSYCLL